MDTSMPSISAYGETVGYQIARVALDHDLRDRVCPDQGPGGWRVVPQFAGAPDFRDRQLLHWSRSQLRRPLTHFDRRTRAVGDGRLPETEDGLDK